MLAELPLESGALGAAPPARLPAGWKDRFTARQRVVNIVVVHAKIAPRVRAGFKWVHGYQPTIQ